MLSRASAASGPLSVQQLFEDRADDTEEFTRRTSVSLAPPLSWRIIGTFIFLSLAVVFICLFSISYERVTTVRGRLVTQTRTLDVYPTRPGVLAAIAVGDGAIVTVGQKLAEVRLEEESRLGVSPAGQMIGSLKRQQGTVGAQLSAAGALLTSQLEQARLDIDTTRAELLSINSQIEIQQSLVRTAREDYEQASSLAERGFVSRRDIRSREDTWKIREQTLGRLQQERVAKSAALERAVSSRSGIGASSAAQIAALEAERERIERDVANAEGSASYIIRANGAGRITAIRARRGEYVDNSTPVLSIVPQNAALEAEIHVPTTSIGFIQPGQSVRLAIDAYPYEKFGTVAGKVSRVSLVPLTGSRLNGSQPETYQVIVSISPGALEAYNAPAMLLSGMTVSARIVEEERSLIEWLFEPIFAAGRR